MKQEAFFTGYCRQVDGSRTVMVEEGEPDCLYPDCPYTQNCPIAEGITTFLQEKEI